MFCPLKLYWLMVCSKQFYLIVLFLSTFYAFNEVQGMLYVHQQIEHHKILLVVSKSHVQSKLPLGYINSLHYFRFFFYEQN